MGGPHLKKPAGKFRASPGLLFSRGGSSKKKEGKQRCLGNLPLYTTFPAEETPRHEPQCLSLSLLGCPLPHSVRPCLYPTYKHESLLSFSTSSRHFCLGKGGGEGGGIDSPKKDRQTHQGGGGGGGRGIIHRLGITTCWPLSPCKREH